MARGTFIISLDCEGLWGMADALSPAVREGLARDRLEAAYGQLAQMLDQLGIAATYAFTGLFGCSNDEFDALRPGLEALDVPLRAFIQPALDEGGRGSWRGDWALEQARSARAGHEIALHGMTHFPWGRASRAQAAADLALLAGCSGALRGARTWVFPRNDEAHLDLLAEAGMTGVRASRHHSSRVASFLSEFHPAPEPDAHAASSRAPVAIPAGYFFNWRHGLRRIVPPALTVHRWSTLIDRAAASGKVAHLWLHPENLASAPTTVPTFERVVEYVARRRDAGAIEVLTQLGYAQRQLSRAVA